MIPLSPPPSLDSASILLAPEILVNVCLKGRLATNRRSQIGLCAEEEDALERRDDDPDGADGRGDGGGGTGGHTTTLLPGPVHPASSRGHPLRALARAAIRSARAGDLRARRGGRCSRLRPVLWRARQGFRA